MEAVLVFVPFVQFLSAVSFSLGNTHHMDYKHRMKIVFICHYIFSNTPKIPRVIHYLFDPCFD